MCISLLVVYGYCYTTDNFPFTTTHTTCGTIPLPQPPSPLPSHQHIIIAVFRFLYKICIICEYVYKSLNKSRRRNALGYSDLKSFYELYSHSKEVILQLYAGFVWAMRVYFTLGYVCGKKTCTENGNGKVRERVWDRLFMK